ncbi:VPLPA-CTERM sorting domain-containing protein [Parvularcula maris]|uniref:VPLPA-CTERM sorting domain-containing protein n=1 Tax=Parvularcula maris TaxID=2965077 RepID=A0A9X2L9U5_9PROT|nr:VPLPA-CTERM sorting domain-containing protein [Parvularcula maris]MCQ8185780.1 VPLPA-CTERM sorting domain-containing protein [Parvularcula maris]
MHRFLTAAASLAALLAGQAGAAMVDLTDPNLTINSSGKTVVATEDGVEISVEAAHWWFSLGSWNWETSPTGGLTQYSQGLGINQPNDWHTVDGKGTNEAIVISAQENGVDVAIRLTSIEFGYFGSNSDFDLLVDDGNGSLDRVINDQNIGANNPALLSELGTAFVIGADQECRLFAGCEYDYFKLKSFSYELLSDIDSEVPVPGALPLFLAGAAGFGALRRKRQG